MELSVYEFLDERSDKISNKLTLDDQIVNKNFAYDYNFKDLIKSDLISSRGSHFGSSSHIYNNKSSQAASAYKKQKTNSNLIISSENLNSSANSSSISETSQENQTDYLEQRTRTAFSTKPTNQQPVFADQQELFNSTNKMLNGMMLASNLMNHTNQMNGDVAASAFSPNNLTGNSMNSSNNTISGLSPSSSYDSFSPRCKEEMSPSSMDCSMDQKKKKGPMPRQQEELCLVCGDRASGYHYNALTCEGCKGFFRRSITKNAVYQCKYGNNCEIDMYMRRKCQECRLKKCLTCGMRPECVVPEYQCAIKRENKRQQKELTKPNSTTKELNNNNLMSNQDSMCVNRIPKLSPQQTETIQKLVFFQEEYESPPEEEVKKITPFTLGESEEDGLKRFKHVSEMTILTVQLIVEYSKKVPGFDTLLREDQITLLKACSSEVMMLRCSRKYDTDTDSILYANNQPYTRENYKSASVERSADELFNFCRNMCILKVDNAEYALITAIVIFSERPNLMEPKKVERIQDYYVNILKTYVENKRQPGKCYFAKLLAILTELRTLGYMNSEMCVSLKFKNKKLPPFLNELWDLES